MIIMKKILYIVSTLQKSGPIIVLSNIVKYLDRDKYEPIVLTLSSEPKNSMKNFFENNLNVKVNTLGLTRVKSIFLAKKNIKKFIKDNNISIIHSHGFRADILTSKIQDIKSISTLHNYPYYDYSMTYGKLQGYIMSYVHLHYLKKISNAYACSESISKMLKTLNNYNIQFIRNGTNIDIIPTISKEKLREKLNLDKDITIFISVGHLSTRKDPLTIIEAFKKCNLKNSKLIFLGDGPLKTNCLKSKNSEAIIIAGKVDNVHEYLCASDYLISASLAEGLPNTILEAMACGLPCILSNILPHIEIHSINTESSMLFQTKNIDELCEKIQKMLSKNYNKMSIASQDIIFNNLSAQIMSQNYQKIYNDI